MSDPPKHRSRNDALAAAIAPEHRGAGLGRWMMETLLAHPQLQTSTHALRTKDAQGLYEPLGFERTE